METGSVFRRLLLGRSLVMLFLAFSLMSAEQIGAVLTQRAQKGATAQTLFNLGFELYYRHGFHKREMTENLATAYASAKGTTESQNRALERAAAYWARELANFNSSHVPGQNLDAGPGPRIKSPAYYKDSQLMKMHKAPRE